MRVHALDPKEVETDTGWKRGPMPPRHAPIFKKSRPFGPLWTWRAIALRGASRDYLLVLQGVPDRNKWQAWLMLPGQPGQGVLLIRIEDQPGRSGLHVHADCDGEPVAGPGGIAADGHRWPDHGNRHRRKQAWTRDTFWRQIRDMLRIAAPLEDAQESFDL